MNKKRITENNIAYTRTRWTGSMRTMARFLYTELIHYYYLYKKLDSKYQHCSNASIKLLDIGFGSGYNISRISRKYRIKTTGTDIIPETVDFYNQKHLPDSKAVLINPRSSKLPFRDCSMDIIVCSHVLEHVPNDSGLITEIIRILRPKGLIYFNIPINEETIPVPNHMRKYTPGDFLRLIRSKGLVISEYFESDGFSRIVSHLGVNPSFINNILKKILIVCLSCIPVPVLELIPLKKSQFICFCTKRK